MESAAGDELSLLRRYAQSRDEAAFAALVRRNVDLVYSAAARRVGDRHLAEDVTQAVFVILAKKAASIRSGPLSAWLLSTVRFAAANALKMERRRRRHEQAAASAAGPLQWARTTPTRAPVGACSGNPTDVLLWQEVAQQLDDAILRLPARDRQAVLLRYFEDRPIADIALAMNVSEGAAKQRLGRAVEKLRQRLARRSGALLGAADGAALAALLASHAVHGAPPGLASAACAAATGGAAAAGAAAAGVSIAKGAMTMMAWAKSKVVAAAVLGVVATAWTGGIVAESYARADQNNPAPTPAAAAAPLAAAVLAQAGAAPGAQPDAKDDESRVSVKNAPPVARRVAHGPFCGNGNAANRVLIRRVIRSV